MSSSKVECIVFFIVASERNERARTPHSMTGQNAAIMIIIKPHLLSCYDLSVGGAHGKRRSHLTCETFLGVYRL